MILHVSPMRYVYVKQGCQPPWQLQHRPRLPMAWARCSEYQLVRGVFTVAINLPIIMLAPYPRQLGSLAPLLRKYIYCSALIAGGISPLIKYRVKADIAVEMCAHSQACPVEMEIEQRGMDAICPYRAPSGPAGASGTSRGMH